MAIHLQRVSLLDLDSAVQDAPRDWSVFQTRPWLEFIAASQGAEPVAALVMDDDVCMGWFSGAIVRRAGLKILGSPLPGWSTSYMGFTLCSEVPQVDLLVALRDFAFNSLRCLHFEVMDSRFRLTDVASVSRRARVTPFHSYQLRLTSDEMLLAGMSQNARRNIRRSVREHVVVDEVPPKEAHTMVDEFYRQVRSAFQKRSLVPTFDIGRVHSMVEHLDGTGHLLMLRARTASDECAATGLFPGLPGSTAFFWMGASDRELLDVRPNEALMWKAMQTWRERGALRFDFGGGGTYKEKYGGNAVTVPWIRWSRLPGLEVARSGIKRGELFAQKTRGHRESKRRD